MALIAFRPAVNSWLYAEIWKIFVNWHQIGKREVSIRSVSTEITHKLPVLVIIFLNFRGLSGG